MGILNWITQGCDSLTATAAPSIDALGLHICIALATIMLVWFGVQESLASAQGGPGFNMAKFMNFFMLITFAYVMVRFYDSTIPGVGYSLRGFINGGAQYLVTIIGNQSLTNILSILDQAQATSGPGVVKALMNPYYAIVYVLIQVILAFFSAVVSVIVAYGAIATAVVGLVGPVFIPFLVFDKLEFLFWGWLRAFIGFCFYKVLAAAVLSIMGTLLAHYYTDIVAFSDPGLMVKQLPLLIILVTVNIYILFKIPALTMSIFSGSTGGHDGGMGIATAAVRQSEINERRRSMSTTTKVSPEITRAAERYLEQYGDPLVMNTYLKITILVLAVVCLTLAALTFESQKALANMHPMIVRINDVGRAEAIDYRNFQYRPQEAEDKYYLTRWAELYFSRNRFTIERDQTNSLYFLNGDVQRAVIEQERKNKNNRDLCERQPAPVCGCRGQECCSRRPPAIALLGPHRI